MTGNRRRCSRVGRLCQNTQADRPTLPTSRTTCGPPPAPFYRPARQCAPRDSAAPSAAAPSAPLAKKSPAEAGSQAADKALAFWPGLLSNWDIERSFADAKALHGHRCALQRAVEGAGAMPARSSGTEHEEDRPAARAAFWPHTLLPTAIAARWVNIRGIARLALKNKAIFAKFRLTLIGA